MSVTTRPRASLGRVSGAQTVTTSAQALWPTPGAPLSGGLQAQIGNLGSFGAWLPA